MAAKKLQNMSRDFLSWAMDDESNRRQALDAIFKMALMLNSEKPISQDNLDKIVAGFGEEKPGSIIVWYKEE